MNRYKKSIIIMTLILIISSSTVSNISAENVVTPPVLIPGIITISNFLKGSEWEEDILIENIDEIDHIVSLSFIGEIESWVTFYKMSNKTVPITSIVVNKSSYVPVTIKINVPEETPNGIYSGNISVAYEDSVTNESGVTVKPTQKAPVYIQVTGEQIINMSVERIVVKDVEIGFPVVNEIDCRNTGNVQINKLDINTLKINIEFFIENNLVGNITKSGRDLTILAPGEIKTYTLYWDTSRLVLLGNYTAFFKISLNENIIYQENKTLEILKQGAFIRSGTLDDLRFEQKPEKGKDAVLLATFTNTGELEIYAQFNATVYRNGAILHEFNTQQIIVPIYGAANYESKIPITDDGEYVVKGHVYYYDTENFFNGKTEEIELTFTIGTVFNFDINNPILIAFIIVIIIVLLILMFFRTQKRKKRIDFKSKKPVKKGREPKKSTIAKTPKRSIRIGRNKEKSPFKTNKESNKKKNQITIKEIETEVKSLKKNNKNNRTKNKSK